MKDYILEQIESAKAFLEDAVLRANVEDIAYAKGLIYAFELCLSAVNS